MWKKIYDLKETFRFKQFKRTFINHTFTPSYWGNESNGHNSQRPSTPPRLTAPALLYFVRRSILLFGVLLASVTGHAQRIACVNEQSCMSRSVRPFNEPRFCFAADNGCACRKASLWRALRLSLSRHCTVLTNQGALIWPVWKVTWSFGGKMPVVADEDHLSECSSYKDENVSKPYFFQFPGRNLAATYSRWPCSVNSNVCWHVTNLRCVQTTTQTLGFRRCMLLCKPQSVCERPGVTWLLIGIAMQNNNLLECRSSGHPSLCTIAQRCMFSFHKNWTRNFWKFLFAPPFLSANTLRRKLMKICWFWEKFWICACSSPPLNEVYCDGTSFKDSQLLLGSQQNWESASIM